MDNSTTEYDEMNLIIHLLALVGLSSLILVIVILQSFIVAVNCIDWLKRRSKTDAEKIITSLGLLRIVHYSGFVVYIITTFYIPFLPDICSILLIITMRTLDFSSIWLWTLLSTFFYFKISTLHNVFFLRLKTFISRRVVHLIIAPVIFSLLYTSILFFDIPMNFSINSSEDMSAYYKRQNTIKYYVNIVWSIFPLLIFFIVSLLLIVLIGLHIGKINNGGNTTSNTDTYHRTLIFTVGSFLSCAFYTTIWLYLQILENPLLVFFVEFFPALHSVLQIYAITKLRNQFFRIIYCGTDCLFNRKAPGPRSKEVVEVTSL